MPNKRSDFVHLHVHTHHSYMDSTITYASLFERCKELGMHSVAITDHGTLAGLPTFYIEAKKHGIKPILGCEFYVAPESRYERHSKFAGEAAYHMVLLAMNQQGLINISSLDFIANASGYFYFPRIDLDVLSEKNEGIIALTGCFHGVLPHLVSYDNKQPAIDCALKLKEIFGDRLFIEIQKSGLKKQDEINSGLVQLSSDLDIALVATNDCHYLTADNLGDFEKLVSRKAGHRFILENAELYLKTPDEMIQSFSDYPESIANTVKIADRCDDELNFYWLLHGARKLMNERGIGPSPKKVMEFSQLYLEQEYLNEMTKLFTDQN